MFFVQMLMLSNGDYYAHFGCSSPADFLFIVIMNKWENNNSWEYPSKFLLLYIRAFSLSLSLKRSARG